MATTYLEQQIINEIDSISRGQGPEADNPKLTAAEMSLPLWLMAADARIEEFRLLGVEQDELLARTDEMIVFRDDVERRRGF
jgi:hypothetical protein